MASSADSSAVGAGETPSASNRWRGLRRSARRWRRTLRSTGPGELTRYRIRDQFQNAIGRAIEVTPNDMPSIVLTGSSPRLKFTSSVKRLAMQKELNFDPTKTIASQVMSEKWYYKQTGLSRFQNNASARPMHGSNASGRVNPLFLRFLRKNRQNGKETCFVAATNRCVRGMIF